MFAAAGPVVACNVQGLRFSRHVQTLQQKEPASFSASTLPSARTALSRPSDNSKMTAGTDTAKCSPTAPPSRARQARSMPSAASWAPRRRFPRHRGAAFRLQRPRARWTPQQTPPRWRRRPSTGRLSRSRRTRWPQPAARDLSAMQARFQNPRGFVRSAA